jgi:uncharacterized protein
MDVHGSPAFSDIAERFTILRCLAGSGVHGTAVEGQDDRDEMGICVEQPQYVIGLSRFEQYIFRTQPEGVRSGAGDLDLVVYSLRKWARLALDGNPTVFLPLFVRPQDLVVCTDLGSELRERSELFVSRQAGLRFLGYLRSQREALMGLRAGTHTQRPELRELYGFDTKFAMHMVRLGVEGEELLRTGRISLPVREPWLVWLRQLRLGQRTKEEALEAAETLEASIDRLMTTSHLPERPRQEEAEAWLVSAYRRTWDWA